MTYADIIANRILSLCKDKKITVNKLATLSGVTQSTMADIVNKKSTNPKLRTLHRIAQGLDMTLSEFLDFPEINETMLNDEKVQGQCGLNKVHFNDEIISGVFLKFL